MAVFVVYIRRQDDWAEIARFEASGTADALNKARHVIPQGYGDGPLRLVEQPAPDARVLRPYPGQER